MKKFMRKKYIYCVIPFAYVYICTLATLKYVLSKDISKAVFTILKGFLFSAIFFVVASSIIYSLDFLGIYKNIFLLIYNYTTSVIISIYFINDYEKYTDNVKK